MLKLFVIFVTVMLSCIAFDGGIWQVEGMENLYTRLFLNCPLYWIKFELILPMKWGDTLNCLYGELANTR